MARYTGPKNKLARKIGEDLGLKSNALKVARRVMVRPGQHGHKGRRKLSDFGLQLKEKQKLKYLYGILETQLQKLYKRASKDPTATGAGLLSLLERRLDNVIYRLGWAPTRAAARQLVSHGHVTINGRKMDVPSYRVRVKDIVVLSNRSTQIGWLKDLINEDKELPEWLTRKQGTAQVTRLPERSDITEVVDEQLVVEFYSR